jgi:hypothetical protein
MGDHLDSLRAKGVSQPAAQRVARLSMKKNSSRS